MSHRLHLVINDTACKSWCGPAAVCAITGWPMSAVRAVLREHVRRARVCGTYVHELVHAFEAAGWQLVRSVNTDGVERDGGVTLAQWLKRRRDRAEITLVELGGRGRGHYVVVCGNRFVDNSTGAPVPIGKAPGRRRRVRAVYACRHVRAAPVPPVHTVSHSRRGRQRPQYRAGYVQAGQFVPVTEWVSAHDLDRDGGIERAEHACVHAGQHEVDDANGGRTLPVAVEHRRHGFVRVPAMWRLLDGFDRVSELDWARDPEVALDTF